MLGDATLHYAEGLTAALLGLDALYAAERGTNARSGGGDIERLVVLNLSTTHAPEPFADYAAARARFAELGARSGDLPEADRRRYDAQTCASAIAFARWRTGGLAFPDQIAGFLPVPAGPATAAELDGLRGEMRDVLVELGYGGARRTSSAPGRRATGCRRSRSRARSTICSPTPGTAPSSGWRSRRGSATGCASRRSAAYPTTRCATTRGA
ncbi:MAG: hypothetical protein AVDCRST_MAG73-3284 [uncultured Thermomicrobiales bacterium]|uniref:Uncharacterized protein n=1 Tax=uncultured Thermomicrobiales bacterium TaxID=1645740 RepID=A0A6J4UNH1_9BACT|nr:MAG: hypothetical protein AVDCRST_MAG73-3284 [uncultured Thermomicrobiales bacterium]